MLQGQVVEVVRLSVATLPVHAHRVLAVREETAETAARAVQAAALFLFKPSHFPIVEQFGQMEATVLAVQRAAMARMGL